MRQVRELLPFLNRLTYHFVTTMPDQAFNCPAFLPAKKSVFCEDSGGLAACSQSTPQQPHLSGLTLRLQALSLCALTCVSTAQICLLYHRHRRKAILENDSVHAPACTFHRTHCGRFCSLPGAKLASCMLLKVIKATAVFAKICKTSC